MSAPDKITARILVISLTVLAAIGLLGTLYLLASGNTDTQVSVFVALAGVPIGAVAALATTRSITQETPQKQEIVLNDGPGVMFDPPKPAIYTRNTTVDTPLLDEMAAENYAVIPGA